MRREYRYPSLPPKESGNALILLEKDCEVCKKTAGLFRCSACQCVYYCSREHQATDRNNHKTACTAIEKFRVRYEHHVEVLSREMEHGYSMPGQRGSLFQVGAGHFWGILETRPYMTARFRLVNASLDYFPCYRHVVQAALDHLLDMLRLCRDDNLGARNIVPGLYLRLGREQDAFDFVKWYATTGNDPNYDWGNMKLPFLNVKDANATEPWPTDRLLNLIHLSTVFLIKMRLLHDFQSAQNAIRAFQGVVPLDIIDLIQAHLFTTNVQIRPKASMNRSEAICYGIDTLKSQLKDLYKAVDKRNPHFWPAMLDSTERATGNKPSGYSVIPDEPKISIGHNLYAWLETPRAFDTLADIDEAIHGRRFPEPISPREDN
ncbi:hypothetical protein EDB81DRAFT_676076 [Dactylonectria macrodidyma]|uniref:MYND-type domain-containing protein n=1 Tax=Dactylonectria macrodidyma TaxID=307937 RepID=A0A9P9FVI0_9HYPO|nr:hypothetical protein EDB81DRAFT_676076 [Dactylonectria macrodidyma]